MEDALCRSGGIEFAGLAEVLGESDAAILAHVTDILLVRAFFAPHPLHSIAAHAVCDNASLRVCTCTLFGITGAACKNTHTSQRARTGGGTLHLNRASVRQQHCFIMAIVTRVELAAARCFHAASPTVVRTARWVVVARLPHVGPSKTCKIAGNRRVSKPFSRCGALPARPGICL